MDIDTAEPVLPDIAKAVHSTLRQESINEYKEKLNDSICESLENDKAVVVVRYEPATLDFPRITQDERKTILDEYREYG